MPDYGKATSHQGKQGLFGSAEICLDEVSKSFINEEQPAVDRINLQVDSGNLVVLLGPSGCGKTTLLKLINRLYEPASGKIFIGGMEIHALPATELRRQIGYVIQQVGLFPHMNIKKNISVVPRLLGWDEVRTEKRIHDLLEMIGLPETYLPRYPRQLSGGEQQRIGLARALAADPMILLMDEPFAAIDAINRESLQGELLEIQRRVHKTILFVTHDVEEAFRLADKIAIMKKGKLIQYGTPLEIVTQPENELVKELVGTENMLRRLRLLHVQAVLDAKENRPLNSIKSRVINEKKSVIHPEDDLRNALSVLLNSGADALAVVNDSGIKIGEISFSDLRAALVEQKPKKSEQT